MSAHPWNTAPVVGDDELPLRQTLPKISAVTQRRLIAWAQRQPSVMSWLLIRSAAYWEEWMRLRDVRAYPLTDAETALFDATASLDLLEWQLGLQGRAAVDRLEGFQEVAEATKHTTP